MITADEPAVQAAGLFKRFGAVPALGGISFEVKAGEIFGLVGPNGAGKTTAVRILAGLLKPDAGFAAVAGHDVARDGERLRTDISYMPQRFGLYHDLTVDENIRFQADLFGVARKERERRAADLLQACGMSQFRGRTAGKLSGGMQQKLSLVCALIHQPKVLLLDEPTSGVDPVSRREFWTMLYDLNGTGVTVVLSTAYLDEAERCHSLGLMYQGKLLMCDTPERLKSRLRGTVVTVLSGHPRKVRELLDAHATFRNSMIVGNEVHLFADDAAGRIPEARAILEETGCDYIEIAAVTPSIEDIFMSAVEGESHSPNL